MTTERTNALTLPDEQTFRRDIEAINRFQKIVHQTMVQGQDYGVIPGTSKPTLLKPGAEKIAKLLGLSDDYEILDRQENWDKGFFRYLVKCKLVSVATGVLISTGLGECNSMESKYRWRESQRKCPNCGKETIIKGKAEYGGGWLCFQKKGGCGAKFPDGDQSIESQSTGRVSNDDIYSQVNTLLKMAKKRALVDAALSAGRLSEVFTQDVEDMGLGGGDDELKVTPAPQTKPSTQERVLNATEQLVEAIKCKDGPALFTFAMKQINPRTKQRWSADELRELTGAANPAEIRDVTAAAKVIFG